MGEALGDGDAPAHRARRPQRTHRGRTLEERRSERRSALREAGLELFGTVGFSATSITEVCRTSGVTTRYFYEEYGTLRALLLDVVQVRLVAIAQQVWAIDDVPPGPERLSRLITSRATAYARALTQDPRLARLVLVESGDEELNRQRHDLRRALAASLTEVVRVERPGHTFDPEHVQLMALLFIGAGEVALRDWIMAAPADRRSVDDITGSLTIVVRSLIDHVLG